MPEQFHFLHPEWFLALIALVPLLWLIRRQDGGESAWRKVCDASLLPYLLMTSHKGPGRLPFWMLAAGWLVAVIALADPAWEKQPQPVFRSQDARIIVLDLSRSMYTPDLKPSRLERVRYKVADVLDRTEEGQTGLVAFAGDAFVVAPLTRDADTIRSLLAVLDPGLMPVQGSRADLGLRKAAELLAQAGIPRGEILLIADGFEGSAAVAEATELRDRGYTVSVLGVGTREGAPLPNGKGSYVHDDTGRIVMPVLDVDALTRLAEAGGGRYADISDNNDDLDRLLAQSGPRLGTRTEAAGLETEVWQSRGPWLVLLLLPLAALAFRRGWLLSVVLLVGGTGATPAPVMASAWDDLWSRRDQQASRALETGDFARAAELAEDPLRRGTAAYRAGNYEQSLEAFAGAPGADAEYNRGNALARLGRYEDAIAAYNKALAEQSGMADAEHNKALLEELLRQQQQQSARNPPESGQQADAGGDASTQANDPSAEEGAGGALDEGGSRPANANQAQAGESRQNAADASPDGRQEDAETASADSATAPAGDKPQAGQGDPDPQTGTADSSSAAGQSSAQAADERQEQGSGPDSRASADLRSTEEQQAAEQWLRRIPDDPGGLLRRKFLYQYRQRAANAATGNDQAW